MKQHIYIKRRFNVYRFNVTFNFHLVTC